MNQNLYTYLKELILSQNLNQEELDNVINILEIMIKNNKKMIKILKTKKR